MDNYEEHQISFFIEKFFQAKLHTDTESGADKYQLFPTSRANIWLAQILFSIYRDDRVEWRDTHCR